MRYHSIYHGNTARRWAEEHRRLPEELVVRERCVQLALSGCRLKLFRGSEMRHQVFLVVSVLTPQGRTVTFIDKRRRSVEAYCLHDLPGKPKETAMQFVSRMLLKVGSLSVIRTAGGEFVYEINHKPKNVQVSEQSNDGTVGTVLTPDEVDEWARSLSVD